MKIILKTFCYTLLLFSLQGCLVGKAVSLPFKATGAMLNTVTPDVVGDSVSATGDVVDTVIPF